MSISINVRHLISMAVDAKNGHINFHFLVRLLEVIVRTSKLDHYYVDFDGIDKGRAQDVYTGVKDMATFPLNDKFNVYLSDDSIEDMQSLNRINRTKNQQVKAIPLTNGQDPSSIRTNSSFGESMEEDCRSYSYEISISEAMGISCMENQKSGLIQSYNPSFEAFGETETLPIYEPLVENSNSGIEAIEISFTESQKSCPMQCCSPSFETIGETMSINEDLVENSNSDVTAIPSTDRQNAYPIQVAEEESEELEPELEMLDSFDSDISSVFDRIETKPNWDSYNLSERQKEKKRINESIAGDVFIDTYGMTQKREKLKNAVTVRDFRVFDLSYRRNFQYLMRKVEALVDTLGKVIKDQNEIKKTFVTKVHYHKFENAVKSTHIEMKNDIKEYISRDPEARGIVQFIKGACISCAKPVMIKTTDDSTDFNCRLEKHPLEPLKKRKVVCHEKIKPTPESEKCEDPCLIINGVGRPIPRKENKYELDRIIERRRKGNTDIWDLNLVESLRKRFKLKRQKPLVWIH